MEIFFPELLDGFPDRDFLENVREKYHYEEARLGELRAVAGEMLPLMRREALWEVCAPWIWNCGERAGDRYEGVVMTLGRALDELQEYYHKRGMLTESYMLETLSGELLLQGYRAYNSRVGEKGDWHVARYHFPGGEEDMPLEMLPRMLSRFSLQIACNEAFCLLPKKSVVFLAQLTQDKTIACEGICVGCGSVSCPNRMKEDEMVLPLPYGYQRILGKW